jgi:hypothetical protein
VDRVVGPDGVRVDIATMRPPDGHGGLELTKFHRPTAVSAGPYHAAVAFDPSDFLLASSSGHGDVHLLRWSPVLEPGYARSVETSDPEFLDNGVAAHANGHAICAFALDEGSHPLEGVRAEWIDRDSTVDLTVIKPSFNANDWTFGVRVEDVAADDGNFALVGEFGGRLPDGVPVVGWVQSCRP